MKYKWKTCVAELLYHNGEMLYVYHLVGKCPPSWCLYSYVDAVRVAKKDITFHKGNCYAILSRPIEQVDYYKWEKISVMETE